MIKEKDILKTDFKKAKKRTWIWSNDYYIEHINPKYGFFLYATLHVPTEIWRNSKLARIEDQLCKVLLHRYYNIEEPSEYWDYSINEGESIVVYNGLIHDGEHLNKLIKDLGIK